MVLNKHLNNQMCLEFSYLNCPKARYVCEARYGQWYQAVLGYHSNVCMVVVGRLSQGYSLTANLRILNFFSCRL